MRLGWLHHRVLPCCSPREGARGAHERGTQFSLALSAIVLVLLVGCSIDKKKPAFSYMQNMVDAPAVKAQEAPMRLPVAGTVARGAEPYHATSLEEAERTFRNPLPRSMKTMERGQHDYNVYCIVCHGPGGEGDGLIVPKFPRPPSLTSEKVRDWRDGAIYHVITKGQNLMPSYASQMTSEERWAVIHYVRALQRAAHPTPRDLKRVSQTQAKE